METNELLLKDIVKNLGDINVISRFIMHATLYNNNLRSEPYRNPFNNYGKKTFSQTDEDGLTFEIVRRLGLEKGVFGEFGVGNGTQNNTLALIAVKWRGFWAGNEDLVFDPNPERVAKPNFAYIKTFITRDNFLAVMAAGAQAIGQNQLDLLSIDLDGNDIYLLELMLAQGIKPKVLIVEYNAKFIPPIDWRIDYADDHVWDSTDYFGASFMAFYNVLAPAGYFPVCCNAFTGSNAFFVLNEYRALFPDVPDEVDKIWCPPMYFLPADYGHGQSVRTISTIIRDAQRG